MTETEMKLAAEVDRLQKFVRDHGLQVEAKLNLIEGQMSTLLKENDRLLRERESAFVERDACVSLLMKLAHSRNLLSTGIAPGNLAVIDLPSGQASWEFGASEAHLFSDLPEYTGTLEQTSARENYVRVMNPQL